MAPETDATMEELQVVVVHHQDATYTEVARLAADGASRQFSPYAWESLTRQGPTAGIVGLDLPADVTTTVFTVQG